MFGSDNHVGRQLRFAVADIDTLKEIVREEKSPRAHEIMQRLDQIRDVLRRLYRMDKRLRQILDAEFGD
jgi:ubiquinone biosynthesis protein UbiJ